MKRFMHLFWNDKFKPVDAPGRATLFHIIFESDSPEGKRFDVLLLFVILCSVLVIVIDSVPGISPFGKYVLRQ